VALFSTMLSVEKSALVKSALDIVSSIVRILLQKITSVVLYASFE
jgi:hypothetical protein